MIKIAICDDSQNDREKLMSLVYKLAEKINFDYKTYLFQSGKELVESKENYNIIFLDIVMEHLDGIETLKLLEDKNTIVIFMSTTSDRLRELFSKNVIAFIDKPIEENDLENALLKALKLISKEETFRYSKNGKINFVKQSEIIYLESEGHYLKIVTRDNIITYKGKIKDAWKELSEAKNFALPNRSFIINFQYVSLASKSEFVVDRINKSISITRINKDETIKRFMEFINDKTFE